MSWLITYQVYDYNEPLGPPTTVVTVTHPIEFRRSQNSGNPNRDCVILFALGV